MLTDRDLQLLTAYVDGEMSAHERKRLTTLLQKSAAALVTLELLERDARRIRDLTRLKLGPDFSEKVIRTLAQNGIRPKAARPPAPAPWVGLTIAASVFVMIAAGSYWYFAPRHQMAQVVADSPGRRPTEGVLGHFTDRALHLAAADLGTDTTRKTLVTKLHQDNAYHVDLVVQDNGRAVQRLAATLEKSGIHVLMPAMANHSKRSGGKITYCLFAENVKPDELAGLLQQLGIHTPDRKDAGVNHVIVDAMTPEHRQKLSTLLGPANSNARQEARDPLGDLVNKRIIPGNPAGQGTSSIKPKVSPFPERFALVLPLIHGDMTGLGDSPELRTFLSRRSGQVPGTVQVFLVVHEAKN